MSVSWSTETPVGERPTVVIGRTASWKPLGFSELWEYRELLAFLAWRDLAIRYKQTLFGVAWAIGQPVLTAAVFSLFFGRLLSVPSDGVAYPVFALSGITLWSFFSSGVTNSGNSLIGSANLITKVYFPRVLIPAAAVLAGIVDLALAIIILIPVAARYQITPSATIILAPVFLGLLVIFAFAIGLIVAVLNVRFRDFRFAVPFALQLGLFVTPVIYPLSVVPPTWRWLLMLNPLTGILEGLRAVLFGNTPHLRTSLVACALVFVSLAGALVLFRALERDLADQI